MLLQKINESVEQSLREIASSGGYRTYQDKYSDELIAQLAQMLASKEVLLTSSGTAAVELALRAAGIGVGDEVILSAYDYPGNFWAIDRVGARPVIVDTEADGWRIDLDSLELASKDSHKGSCKALIASHLHGQLQDVGMLREWCDLRGMLLIEDACQALGAEVGGKPVGSYGNAGILSFGGGKMLSAGRGGALVTSDTGLALKARIAAGAGSGAYLLSELQSAVVLAQLVWLDEIIQQCRNYFGEFLHALPSHSTVQAPFAEFLPHTSFYQAGLLFDIEASHGLENMIEKLRTAGIAAGRGFAGFHRRSSRRCRIASPLRHTSQIVDRTITIHHSIALDGRFAARQTALLLDRLS